MSTLMAPRVVESLGGTGEAGGWYLGWLGARIAKGMPLVVPQRALRQNPAAATCWSTCRVGVPSASALAGVVVPSACTGSPSALHV